MLKQKKYCFVTHKSISKLGAYMLESIKKMCKQHPNIISNARGLGTFSSFDGATVEVRDQIVQRLKNIGKFIYFK
jgi:4-aminobutyrate aminotransferase-like enzyme